MLRGSDRKARERGANIAEARPRRAPDSERGAVLIEAAFVFPLLMFLTFAVVEFGMLYGNTSTTAAASRSGARLVSTNYAGSGDHDHTADVVAARVRKDLLAMSRGEPIEMWIFKSNSGRPTACTSANRCRSYQWIKASNDFATGSGSWDDPDACGDTVDTVGVWIKTRHPFLTNFFGTEKIITEQTTMRLEPLPTDQCS